MRAGFTYHLILLGVILFLSISCALSQIEKNNEIVYQERSELSNSELEKAIEKTLTQRRYLWNKVEKQSLLEDVDESNWFLFWIKNSLEWVKNKWKEWNHMLRQLVESWFERLGGSHNSRDRNPADPVFFIKFFAFIILALFISWMVYYWFKHRKHITLSIDEDQSAETVSIPDLEDEDISPDQLPSDEWAKLAEEMFEKREMRLGLRALFLSLLAQLGHTNFIQIRASKSNRDYLMELERRFKNKGNMIQSFRHNIQMIEMIWYGDHLVTETMIDSFKKNSSIIQLGAKS
ncbi:MAG: hypothetical protein AAGA18_06740 [Verrucomicrobiota bacterium]